MKNKKIEFDGKEFKSLREFADFYSINFSTFYKHLRQGESIENIIAMHSKRIKYTDHDGNEYYCLSDMLKAYNIPKKTYLSRLRQKWSLKKILTTQIKQFEYEGIEYHSLLDFCKKNKISQRWIPLLREILKKWCGRKHTDCQCLCRWMITMSRGITQKPVTVTYRKVIRLKSIVG